MREPNNVGQQTADKNPPDIGASLQWIHGYDGSMCRNNVRYSAGGEVGRPRVLDTVLALSFSFTFGRSNQLRHLANLPLHHGRGLNLYRK